MMIPVKFNVCIHLTYCLFSTLFTALFSSMVFAQPLFWEGGLDGNWDSYAESEPIPNLYFYTSNWKPDGGFSSQQLYLPNSSDDVNFGERLTTEYNINLNGNREVNSLVFDDNTGFSLNNNTLILNNSLTAQGTATHTINSDVILNNIQYWDIAQDAILDINGQISGASHLDLIGVGTTNFNNTNNFSSIYINEGSLNIQNGAKLSNLRGWIGLSGSTAIVNVTGQNTSWDTTYELNVGYISIGKLNIKDGATVTNANGNIGLYSNATGEANVTGQGSAWNNNGNLTIGSSSGYGTLNIENRGHVNVTGTTIIDAGSAINNDGSVYVGSPLNANTFISSLNTSSLNIQNGSSVSNQGGYIGFLSDTYGIATVTGTGSNWYNATRLEVGYLGNGELNIQNGGTVSNTEGRIGNGQGASGTVSVTGLGSTWNNSDSLYVGDSGSGTLLIEGAGKVLSNQGLVGYNVGSIGLATVTDSNSMWINTSGLIIGLAGNGTLNILNGGMVQSSGSSQIGSLNYPTSTGVVNVSGIDSTWHNTGDISINRRATLNIQDHAAVSTTRYTSIDGGTLIINNAQLSTGYLFHRGDITIQLSGNIGGGSSVNSLPFINVTHQISLEGTLTIDLLDQYIPEPGPQFDMFKFGFISGALDSIIPVNAPVGLYFDLIIDELAGTGIIEAKAHLPGDANLDGIVNIQDLSKLAANFNTNNNWFVGDFNLDGIINIQDLSKQALNFNRRIIPNEIAENLFSVNSLGGGSVIPEPASFAIFVMSVLTLSRRRRD